VPSVAQVTGKLGDVANIVSKYRELVEVHTPATLPRALAIKTRLY
jgi:hypothetical protein